MLKKKIYGSDGYALAWVLMIFLVAAVFAAALVPQVMRATATTTEQFSSRQAYYTAKSVTEAAVKKILATPDEDVEALLNAMQSGGTGSSPELGDYTLIVNQLAAEKYGVTTTATVNGHSRMATAFIIKTGTKITEFTGFAPVNAALYYTEAPTALKNVNNVEGIIYIADDFVFTDNIDASDATIIIGGNATIKDNVKIKCKNFYTNGDILVEDSTGSGAAETLLQATAIESNGSITVKGLYAKLVGAVKCEGDFSVRGGNKSMTLFDGSVITDGVFVLDGGKVQASKIYAGCTGIGIESDVLGDSYYQGSLNNLKIYGDMYIETDSIYAFNSTGGGIYCKGKFGWFGYNMNAAYTKKDLTEMYSLLNLKEYYSPVLKSFQMPTEPDDYLAMTPAYSEGTISSSGNIEHISPSGNITIDTTAGDIHLAINDYTWDIANKLTIKGSHNVYLYMQGGSRLVVEAGVIMGCNVYGTYDKKPNLFVFAEDDGQSVEIRGTINACLYLPEGSVIARTDSKIYGMVTARNIQLPEASKVDIKNDDYSTVGSAMEVSVGSNWEKWMVKDNLTSSVTMTSIDWELQGWAYR